MKHASVFDLIDNIVFCLCCYQSKSLSGFIARSISHHRDVTLIYPCYYADATDSAVSTHATVGDSGENLNGGLFINVKFLLLLIIEY